MTTAKLSPAQRRFLDNVTAAGAKGYDCPHAWSRASVTLVSAWQRTADVLHRRGIVRRVRTGYDAWTAYLPEHATMLPWTE